MASHYCRRDFYQIYHIDGYGKTAIPCPSEFFIMAPRCSDPGDSQRSCHTRMPKSDNIGPGIPPATSGLKYWRSWMLVLVHKSKKNRLGTV